MKTLSFSADRHGITLRLREPLACPALSLMLNGRSVWSFRPPGTTAEAAAEQEAFIPWPAEFAERLTGWARMALSNGGTPLTDEQIVVFTDSGTELAFRDALTGQPLVINKWQRISKSFEGRQESLIDDLLDRAGDLIAQVRTRTGLSLFVTGGTLLGPVRDGRIMPHDDDADLAYLSSSDNPSDVALESFSLERMLQAAGYEVIRLSAGHLQIMFPGNSLTDEFYIDIFAYFVCEGWFYGTFHARERAHRVPILPLQDLQIGSRELPGPADPPALLSAIYGPEWQIPDPAFTFVTPPAALRRYRGWLSDVNMDREAWEQRHREVIAEAVVPPASSFAERVAERISSGSNILELGCAFGSDARFLAAAGHRVLGIDYSRPALVHARSHQDADHRIRFRRANLSSARETVKLSAGAASLDLTTHVYARSLFDALGRQATETTLALVRRVLNKPDSRAHLEFSVGDGGDYPGWTERRAVDITAFTSSLSRQGLVVEDRTSAPSDDRDGVERVRMTLKKETG